ncbi:hypothetical protein FGO68_gene6381 [Halteria grandinella]|uniref:C2 domain-containing protein n=1 Tax=Halteria grandinella TaxID=5974 RepID=A0A8J8P0T4_HALGN|nr:hypothetical protein FGO68_gene6381 [Halteria grandinella]
MDKRNTNELVSHNKSEAMNHRASGVALNSSNNLGSIHSQIIQPQTQLSGMSPPVAIPQQNQSQQQTSKERSSLFIMNQKVHEELEKIKQAQISQQTSISKSQTPAKRLSITKPKIMTNQNSAPLQDAQTFSNGPLLKYNNAGVTQQTSLASTNVTLVSLGTGIQSDLWSSNNNISVTIPLKPSSFMQEVLQNRINHTKSNIMTSNSPSPKAMSSMKQHFIEPKQLENSLLMLGRVMDQPIKSFLSEELSEKVLKTGCIPTTVSSSNMHLEQDGQIEARASHGGGGNLIKLKIKCGLGLLKPFVQVRYNDKSMEQFLKPSEDINNSIWDCVFNFYHNLKQDTIKVECFDIESANHQDYQIMGLVDVKLNQVIIAPNQQQLKSVLILKNGKPVTTLAVECSIESQKQQQNNSHSKQDSGDWKFGNQKLEAQVYQNNNAFSGAQVDISRNTQYGAQQLIGTVSAKTLANLRNMQQPVKKPLIASSLSQLGSLPATHQTNPSGSIILTKTESGYRKRPLPGNKRRLLPKVVIVLKSQRNLNNERGRIIINTLRVQLQWGFVIIIVLIAVAKQYGFPFINIRDDGINGKPCNESREAKYFIKQWDAKPYGRPTKKKRRKIWKQQSPILRGSHFWKYWPKHRRLPPLSPLRIVQGPQRFLVRETQILSQYACCFNDQQEIYK